MTIKIGLVGCGFISRSHLRGWRRVPDAEVVAVSDVDLARARERAAEFDVPRVYGSLQEMLQAEALDAIDVLTPPPGHKELVLIAAVYGKPILCQKPLALELSDAEEMIAACHRHGVRLMVNENTRWDPLVQALRSEIAGGTIGTPFYARFDSRYPIAWPTTEYPNSFLLNKHRFLTNQTRLIISEKMIHFIDVARFLFGDAETVYAQTQNVSPLLRGDDLATLVIKFPQMFIVVESSWCSKGYIRPSRRFVSGAIEGTEGTIFLGGQRGVTVVSDQRGTYVPAFDPDPQEEETFYRAQAHFVECLRTGAPFETGPEDNYKTLAIALKAYESAASNQVVAIPRLDAGGS
ncbi:MAG TPA: hypothetical protein DEP84_31845 [Chloroflexi bacterium]|nr:hypothetical protein [Chloroflexota bacterium]